MKIELLFSRNWLVRRNVVSVVLTMKGSGFRALLLAAIFVLTPHFSGADVVEAWVRRYNAVATNSLDQASKVVIDKLGDVIVAGYTDQATTGADMLTIKYSGKDGSLIWKRLYDGPAHFNDSASALTIDENNNVIITGSSASALYNFDFYTAKYSASDGALVWERRYDGPANSLDAPHGIVIDRSGNVVVTGYSRGADAQGDFYTAKYAAQDGVLLWERRYDGPSHRSDEPRGIAVDSQGNILVTGYSVTDGGDVDHYTVKYAAADGAVLWEKRYDGPAIFQQTVAALAVDRGDNAIVTAASKDLSGLYRYHTIKYAANDGALIWERHGPAGYPVAISTDLDGNALVIGPSAAKFAAGDGAVLWQSTYASGPYDRAQALTVDTSGNVLVTGHIYNGTDRDYSTKKYRAADGTLLWEQRSSSGAYRNDYATSVAIDHAGDVIVTGHTYNTPNSSDLRTEKYDGTTGALLWRSDFNDLANGNDQPRAIAMDAHSSVIVTGTSWNGETVSYTAKYAAADGAILWERRYDGPGNSHEYPAALVLDAQGNVFVTGMEHLVSSLGGGVSTMTETHLTAKYASLDGAVLWQKIGPRGFVRGAAVLPAGDLIVAGALRTITTSTSTWHVARYASLDGALIWEKSGPQGSANAVAVDPFGNIIATGGAHPRGDFYTAKYRANDGSVIWDQRYIGSSHTTYGARAVAVDSDGDVAVTGSAYNGRGLHFYTAKYRAIDGILLWERSYFRGYEDGARAVAVDRRGNVIVTGSSSSGTNFDAYTAKYAARDGRLLWQVLRPGGTGEAVALDEADDVVLAGNSLQGGPYYSSLTDYHTAKYAGTDGALLWEKQYSSSLRHDRVFTSRCLAVGANGVIAVTGASDTDLSPAFSYDFATVVYWENISPVAIDRLSFGVRVRFAGIPGRIYHLQRASALDGLWTTLSTQTAPANRMIEYLDDTRPTGSAFYRVRID